METREVLKKEIITYLNEVGVTDKSLIAKALQCIKDSACRDYPIDADMLRDRAIRDYTKAIGFSQGDAFYYRISWYFAPRHYASLVSFIKRFEAILEAECEAEEALESAIQEEIAFQVDPLGDEYYDELGAPDFAICVYGDRIEVRAYEPGVGSILPKKGRKYIGSMHDIRWQFPLSCLDELKRSGRPIVSIEDLQR